ncbi:HlyD family type I secretion periplasmic adaptor subunit [Nitratireductor basaltis]|uniref:Membrane fusion protein (MFP) family protein n=1 Tax=Nitratireductor basaltis TaxID=472175 RepID=A0A084U8H9_9HYPH|nr:HlyD family type I secretion periplasmic adaptor subunit [Nitratireductor basaltis]KFB09265.1 Type I secretion membrane fusion protein, HlyD family [Nitratireductor basaltis]
MGGKQLQRTDVNEWYAEVPRSIRKQTIVGLALMMLVGGGFGAWAGFAPLASAIIAPGSFVATGKNKIVQHLEGGVIEEILAHEGDTVREGQELIRLDETAALANVRQLELRQLRLQAMLARLKAQAHGDEVYDPPEAIVKNLADADIAAIHNSQKEIFSSALIKQTNQVRLLEENIQALTFQLQGIDAQVASMRRQQEILTDEFNSKSSLLKKGIVTRSSIRLLERAIADADGDIVQLESEGRIAQTQIAKYRMEIAQVRDAAQKAAYDEIQAVEADLDTVREQIRSARAVLGRTSIQAPVTGIVIRSYYHTSGGVIESGRAIMEILPSDEALIIEAQVPRMQIDEVRVGQAASIRLSALNQRTTPVLEGEVMYVSADAVTASATSPAKDIYIARVEIPNEQLQRVKGFAPTPGMPAEILIQTHERTFFEYLAKPITDSMARAFREY